MSFILATLLPLSSFAGEWNTNRNGVVLDEYGVVSYRNNDQAIKGSSKLSAKYDGSKFYFSNSEFSFSRVFKRMTGLTPVAVRKSVKE